MEELSVLAETIIQRYYSGMVQKNIDDERSTFSIRLRETLRARGIEPSPSKICLEFNLRADGLSVSVHGVRKWLIGEAIPSQARMKVLADWLGVRAAWLRFGDGSDGDYGQAVDPGFEIHSSELAFVHDMRLLSKDNRKLLRDMLDAMLKWQRAIDGNAAT